MSAADLVRLGIQALAAALFLAGHVVLCPICPICAIGAVDGAAAVFSRPGVASTAPRGSGRRPPVGQALAGPAATAFGAETVLITGGG
ncbi:hypothetical protein ACH4D5_06245 [Streptomyces sp. NPDC018029]|uniref:hypothetical protein n=1 Tax=Streptomyces sp. NPDC018029 TaxID=3365032 RepID=UPI0037A7A4D2